MSAVLKEPLSEQELIERYGEQVTRSLNCNELATVDSTKGYQGFQPGVSGNPKGRPVGTRNKLSEHFLQDLHDLWTRETADGSTLGTDVLLKVAQTAPEKLLAAMVQVLPKDFQVNVTEHKAHWVINAQPLTSAQWIAHHSLAQPIDMQGEDQGTSEDTNES